MIDLDNPPLVMAVVIALVFLVPFFYSFYVDNWDKGKKGIDTYGK